MNMIELSGRLTADPEERTTTNGTTVASFSLAVARFKGDDEFHRCKAFGKTAENLIKYKHKGDYIIVTGEQRAEKYTKDGTTKTDHYVEVRGIEYVPTGKKETYDDENTDLPF